MISLATTQLWVHDQDEALTFYTEKVGLEIRQDVTMPQLGNFRWLTVAWPGERTAIVLMAIPGEPVMDNATKDQVADLMGKGFAGTVFFETDDCRKAYEDLSARGVEFIGEPTQTPYGIDVGFRDPSGNNIRLTELNVQL